MFCIYLPSVQFNYQQDEFDKQLSLKEPSDLSNMNTLVIPKANIVRMQDQEKYDVKMRPSQILVIELDSDDIYEVYGNRHAAFKWSDDQEQLILHDDLQSDWLIVRKRVLKRQHKAWLKNFDRELPHPLEFLSMTINGKRTTLMTYVMRAGEESRIYQLDNETGSHFLERVKKAFNSQYFI